MIIKEGRWKNIDWKIIDNRMEESDECIYYAGMIFLHLADKNVVEALYEMRSIGYNVAMYDSSIICQTSGFSDAGLAKYCLNLAGDDLDLEKLEKDVYRLIDIYLEYVTGI